MYEALAGLLHIFLLSRNSVQFNHWRANYLESSRIEGVSLDDPSDDAPIDGCTRRASRHICLGEVDRSVRSNSGRAIGGGLQCRVWRSMCNPSRRAQRREFWGLLCDVLTCRATSIGSCNWRRLEEEFPGRWRCAEKIKLSPQS